MQFKRKFVQTSIAQYLSKKESQIPNNKQNNKYTIYSWLEDLLQFKNQFTSPKKAIHVFFRSYLNNLVLHRGGKTPGGKGGQEEQPGL